MTAKELMDSRRFCLLMDDLAKTWKKRDASDEDKEYRLNAVIEFVSGQTIVKPIHVPKPLDLEIDENVRAQAAADRASQISPQDIVNQAVLEVIVPNWASTIMRDDGFKYFVVKSPRKGNAVSFDVEKWQVALKLHKLPFSSIEFQISGLGQEPGEIGAAQWIVKIG